MEGRHGELRIEVYVPHPRLLKVYFTAESYRIDACCDDIRESSWAWL